MRVDFEAHYYTQNFLDSRADKDDIPIYDTKKQWMYHGGDCVLPIAPIIPLLTELGDGRIRDMDAAGVDVAALSASIGVEQLPAEEGVFFMKDANDALVEAMKRHPGRFIATSILAPKDIKASVEELERTAKLGFKGWNAFSNFDSLQLDDERFFPLLETAARLGLYVYIHPTGSQSEYFKGYGPTLVTSGFGFAIDVATCVARMILAGVFDRLPDLKIVIGHTGEALPFLITRFDDADGRVRHASDKQKNLKKPSEYFRSNIWMTTSGNFSGPAFFCARDTFGIDRLLFGSDYPMENLQKGVSFIESLGITQSEKEMVFSENAKNHFIT